MPTTTLSKAQHSLMLALAVAYMRRLDERRRTYEEECRRDSAQGYRPHYCIHGMNLWTDYDPICGPCEDGYTDRELALAQAHTDVRSYMARLNAVNAFTTSAKEAGQDVGRTLTDTIWDWVQGPLEILTTHRRPTRNLP